jgi:hypothetical protein
MVVLLHGVAGGWDEVAIAVAAFAVLWVAIKLAGRKLATDEDDEDTDADADAESKAEAEHSASARPTTVEEPTHPTRTSSNFA